VGAEDDGTLANLRACDDLDIPAELLMAELVWSLMSFPSGTGLGWDRVHPKALLRADPQWIAALLKLLIRCEATGQWPQVIELVIICLLPKPDGGFRPIGLLPVLPRIWMRSRRNATQLWERRNNKSYLYAGEGKGAQVAAWQQSARAEAATRFKAAYAQGLLDLVKAFDSVPFRILVREAKKLGYSLRILRLSLLTYTMPRSLRVGMVFSRLLVARCGITAGSGTACTEMRVLMIHVVDAARLEYQLVIPTLYVDDLSAEITASRQAVHDMLVGFLRLVCRMIEEMGMEVSRTKSVCTASDPKLGRGIAAELTEYGITYVDRAKSLGAGLGGGTRRNAIVQRKRLTALQARIASFRKLRAMAIDTAKLLRAGGNSGLNYNAAITGVPPPRSTSSESPVRSSSRPWLGGPGRTSTSHSSSLTGPPRERPIPFSGPTWFPLAHGPPPSGSDGCRSRCSTAASPMRKPKPFGHLGHGRWPLGRPRCSSSRRPGSTGPCTVPHPSLPTKARDSPCTLIHRPW